MIPHRKRVQSLLEKRGRKQHGQFLVEGARLVEELLASPLAVERIYHLPALPDARSASLFEAARRRGIPLAEVTPEELLTLCDTQTPQGVVAVAAVPRWTDADVWANPAGHGDVLVLDDVRDPGNLGTLLRTAEAAGVRAVVVMRGTVEVTNPKVVRASMGALFRVPILESAEPAEVAERCRAAGLPLVLTSAHEGEPPARLLAYPTLALVLGGEAEGARQEWEGLADHRVRLPTAPNVESLNVAVAGGIVLFRRIWASRNGTVLLSPPPGGN